MVEKILVVDDADDIRVLLHEVLNMAGYKTLEAANGTEALCIIETESPDLVILDIALPGISGFHVLRQLRKTSEVPVIMLSARTNTVDKVESLELGADDYITKPFKPEELTARVEAILRRSQRLLVKSNELRVTHQTLNGELLIDVAARRVTLSGRNIIVSEIEFRLLLELVANEGKAITYSELLVNVWGTQYKEETNYLHTYVRLLRMKIEPDPKNPRHIVNIPKIGYRFDRTK